MEFIRTNPGISTGLILAATSFAYDKFVLTDPEKAQGIVGPFIGGALSYKIIEYISGSDPMTSVAVALILNAGGRLTYQWVK